MFDALFQALFSYRPVVFQQAEFRFDITRASFVAAAIVTVVAVAAIFTYRRIRVSDGRLRDRIVLTSLRLAALAVVLFCLFPTSFAGLAWFFGVLCWITTAFRAAAAWRTLRISG